MFDVPQPKTLGERLAFVRKRKGMSLEEFVKPIGYTRSYLSRLERGLVTNPSSEFLHAIEKTHGVSEHWIKTGLGESQVPSAPFGTPEFEVAVRSIIEEGFRTALNKVRAKLSKKALLKGEIEVDIAWLDGEQITVLLRKPGSKELKNLLLQFEADQKTEPLLFACLPEERRSDRFLNEITPESVLALEYAVLVLIFGASGPHLMRSLLRRSSSEQFAEKVVPPLP